MNKVLSKADWIAFLKLVCSEVPQTGHSDAENHVYRSYTEASAALSNKKLRWPVIQTGSLTGRLTGQKDTFFDLKRLDFAVLFPAPNQNFDAEIDAIDNALEIGFKIIEKMIKHYTLLEYVQRLNTDSVSYQEVRSTLDQSVGVQFTIELGSQRGLDNEA